MRTIIIISVWAVLSCFSLQSRAQDNMVEKKAMREKVELTDSTKLVINDTTYLYNKRTKTLRRASDHQRMKAHAAKHEKRYAENMYIENLKEDSHAIYRQVFSQERIQKLQGSRLYIMCEVDRKGNIASATFFIEYAPSVTPEELAALDKAFREHTFATKRTDERQTYYTFAFICDFQRLLEEE